MTQIHVDFLEAREDARYLTDLCHHEAVTAGWWKSTVNHEVAGESGRDVKNNATFAQCLMLIVSELAEAMEGDRKRKMDEHLRHRDSREVELADALIRIFDLAGAYDLDVGGAMVEKMQYNRIRADHKREARDEEGGKKY